MSVTVHLQANLQWFVRPSTTSDRWIAVCEPMNIVQEAESLDELHSLIGESIHLRLTDLLEDGELDAFLRGQGWQATGIPDVQDADGVTFDAPFEMITKGNLGDTERRIN